MSIVSIIVPVYKVEQYLSRCVDSILAQTFSDFELILVDDGSPDNCGAICDRYAETDPRIKVIHKENGGLASARNAGMDIATGEYLLFCDSDDYVLPQWAEHLIRTAQDYPDRYVFGNMLVEHQRADHTFREERQVFSGEYSFSDFFISDLPGYGCNAVFRIDKCNSNGLRFPEDVIVEDLPFVLSYFAYCNGLFACPCAEYVYYHDERETLSKKYYIDGYKRWQEKYQCLQEEIGLLLPAEVADSARRSVATRYLYRFLSALNNTFDPRNPASLCTKLRFNQQIVNTVDFQECLRLADGSREDKRYLFFLKNRSYYAAYMLQIAAKIKKRVRGVTK